jgi:hypothetical protein
MGLLAERVFAVIHIGISIIADHLERPSPGISLVCRIVEWLTGSLL